ncbi:hypothetical protein [Geodermatophilus sp. DSM 45219]|uniref:hypothetical protein n=1 Tax=Geodermatophilus sp. DSM 45219 TaxID=1881103 RepID=UPI0008833295|nr:hypothetical protein [Geodermatophilus sp. DSM 45219]SDN79189.1 hypothetical protein SAMN05428965_1644 [Geodermatophilus sp. DSM 45219]
MADQKLVRLRSVRTGVVVQVPEDVVESLSTAEYEAADKAPAKRASKSDSE